MKDQNKKNIVKTVTYDEENIKEVVKLLNDIIDSKGIEKCVLATTMAQRLNSFIKQGEMEVE